MGCLWQLSFKVQGEWKAQGTRYKAQERYKQQGTRFKGGPRLKTQERSDLLQETLARKSLKKVGPLRSIMLFNIAFIAS